MANGTQTVSAVITADAKPFKKSVNEAGDSFKGFTKAAQGFGVVAAAAFAAASAAAVAFLADSVKAAAKSEAIARGLQNAAENAGVFASQAGGIEGATQALSDYAEQLGETIGLDDEKILGIVSQWLAVPQLASLGVDGLKNLTKVAADVAAGTNKDLDSIASAFVKVAGDGETALSKLLRQGIVFTDEQKNVYESLLASNDELGAQQYLIDTLGDKYEGAAEAIANPFDRIAEIFGNFQEQVGQKLLPAFDDIIPEFEQLLDTIASDPEFIKFLEDAVQQFKELAPQLADSLPQLLNLAEVAIPVLIEFLPVVTDLFKGLGGAVEDTTGAVEFLSTWVEWSYKPLGILIGLIQGLATGFTDTTSAMKEFLDWWNRIWDVQAQANALLGIDVGAGAGGGGGGGGGVFTPTPIYSDDRRPSLRSTYNINVNAIAPTAEVGRAVVKSIQDYRRVGGVFA